MSLRRWVRRACSRTCGTTKVLIKVGDSFLKSRDNAVFFVVGWEYDAQAYLGRFNVASVGSGIGFGRLEGLLAGLALCKPAVVPAW